MKALNSFFIKTYGCQMNELDSCVIEGMLLNRGMQKSESELTADLIIFNTCSIRDLAERKVFGKLGQLGRGKKRAIIGVMGCMSISKKTEIFKKMSHVDFVMGPNNIHNLDEALDRIIAGEKQVILTDDKSKEDPDYLCAERHNRVSTSVSVIKGCNKFCTYCVVPYTRGREISRPMEKIENEVQILAKRGYKEISLLGQNVNSYGKDFSDSNTRFHDLLYRLDKIEGIERIRFMTSHPIDITVELMQAVRDLPSVCEFVHFPMQSGSDRILKLMNRYYSRNEYIEKVQKFRSIVPDVSFGTDVIVGFPTESEEDFNDTYTLFDEVGYSLAFIFAYSPRKGTRSIKWPDDVPQSTKQQRLQTLTNLYDEQGERERASFVGNSLGVLFERHNKNGYLHGRTRCFKKIIAKGKSDLIGSIQTVKVTGFNHKTLIGIISQT